MTHVISKYWKLYLVKNKLKIDKINKIYKNTKGGFSHGEPNPVNPCPKPHKIEPGILPGWRLK